MGTKAGLVGVQRKEIADLIASVRDGRLAKELAQMTQLAIGVLVIEGRVRWTSDGELLSSRSAWTRAQHLGLTFSIQSQGYWINSTEDMDDTMSFVLSLEKWLSKERHTLGRVRPKVKGEWGNATSKEWGIHLLQSFPGVGYGQATAIYERFGGVPLAWTVEEWDLMDVKGIGARRAGALIRALSEPESGS